MNIPNTSVLNKTVSFVRSFTDHLPQNINLWRFLTNNYYRPQIDQIRAATDKAERDLLKSRLPAVTISGLFDGKRSASHLIKHSGLMSFDLDHVADIDSVRLKIQKLPFVAYLSLSASGKGLFGIVPILYADKHKEHFQALSSYFIENKLPVLDPTPSNVASLRVYSYDDDVYVNHHAVPFSLIDEKPKPARVKLLYDMGTMDDITDFNEHFDIKALLSNHGWSLCSEQVNKQHFTRPGKDKGISATLFTDTRKFYVFTSSSNFEAGSTHDAFSLYRILECGGHYGECYRRLRQLELLAA